MGNVVHFNFGTKTRDTKLPVFGAVVRNIVPSLERLKSFSVTQNKAQLVIESLVSGQYSGANGNVYIPIDGEVHERIIPEIVGIVRESAGRDYDIMPMRVNERIADGLGHWVADYTFILEFKPK